MFLLMNGELQAVNGKHNLQRLKRNRMVETTTRYL
jgi:hypothetical protein